MPPPATCVTARPDSPAPRRQRFGEVHIWISTLGFFWIPCLATAQTQTYLVGAAGVAGLRPPPILALPPRRAPLPSLPAGPPGRPGPALVPRIASPRAGGAPWSPGPALSRYGCGDRQLPDPAEATGEGVQQRPGVGLQAPLQPQQRRALPVREARSRGIQQSALLQRPQEAGEAETRSVAARRVGLGSGHHPVCHPPPHLPSTCGQPRQGIRNLPFLPSGFPSTFISRCLALTLP